METSAIQDLCKTGLFAGISHRDAEHLLSCLDTQVWKYTAAATVIEEGSCVRRFGVLLNGQGRSYRTDPSGRTITITLLREGSEIGVLLAASRECKSPVSVEVSEGSSILFISYTSLTGSCCKNCPCHKQLLQNFMGIVAQKGLVLHERIDCLLKPTAREKILTYLNCISREKESSSFTIPMDRSAMAEYLNIDRSALSRELSRMKADGILDYYKNQFRLMKSP